MRRAAAVRWQGSNRSGWSSWRNRGECAADRRLRVPGSSRVRRQWFDLRFSAARETQPPPLRRVGRRRSLRFGGFLGIRSRRALRKAANKAADAGRPGEGKISKQTPQGIFWPWPAARLRFGLRFHIRLRLPGMAHRRRSFTRHPPVERGKNITKIGSVMSFAWRHSRDGAPSLPGSLRISSQLCAHPLESALMEPRHLH
jgi:hypothetical protein